MTLEHFITSVSILLGVCWGASCSAREERKRKRELEERLLEEEEEKRRRRSSGQQSQEKPADSDDAGKKDEAEKDSAQPDPEIAESGEEVPEKEVRQKQQAKVKHGRSVETSGWGTTDSLGNLSFELDRSFRLLWRGHLLQRLQATAFLSCRQ